MSDATLTLRLNTGPAHEALGRFKADLNAASKPLAQGLDGGALAKTVQEIAKANPTLRQLRDAMRDLDKAMEDAADDKTRQSFAAMRGELERVERQIEKTARAMPSQGLLGRIKSEASGRFGAMREAGGGSLAMGAAMGVASAGATAAIGAATAAVAALGAAIHDTVQTGMAFDAMMSQVQAKSGASAEEIEQLREQAITLGASSVYSASEVAAAMKELGAAGMSTEQIMAAVPGVLSAAASEGMDLAEAASTMSDTLTQFGLGADQSSRVADVLAQAANASSAGISDLGHALRYAAPMAAAMGLTVEDTTAAVMALAQAGIRGEQAGTTLRGGFTALVNPGKQAADAMDRIGLKVADATGKMKPLPVLIGELESRTSKMTQTQRAATVAQIVGTEASSGFLALMRQGQPALEGYRTSLESAAGAAEKMAAVQMDNLKGDLQELSGAWETLQIRLFDTADSPMRGVVEALSEVVKDMTTWVEENADTLRRWGAEAGRMLEDLIALGGAIGQMVSFVADLGSGFGLLGSTMDRIHIALTIVDLAARGLVIAFRQLQAGYYELLMALAEPFNDKLADDFRDKAAAAREASVGIAQASIALRGWRDELERARQERADFATRKGPTAPSARRTLDDIALDGGGTSAIGPTGTSLLISSYAAGRSLSAGTPPATTPAGVDLGGGGGGGGGGRSGARGKTPEQLREERARARQEADRAAEKNAQRDDERLKMDGAKEDAIYARRLERLRAYLAAERAQKEASAAYIADLEDRIADEELARDRSAHEAALGREQARTRQTTQIREQLGTETMAGDRAVLEAMRAAWQAQLSTVGAAMEKEADQLVATTTAASDQVQARADADAERAELRRERNLDRIDYAAQAADMIGTWLFDRESARLDERERREQAMFEARMERIDAEEQVAYDRLDAETGRKRVLTNEEQAYEDRKAQIAADAEAKRQQLQKEQDNAERRRQRDRAEFEKKQALWRLVLATAQGVALLIAEGKYVQAAVAGGFGAAQVGLLAAQRIPQFATGVTGFGGGMAIVGERGPELVTLGRGTNVVTNENTRRIVERAAATMDDRRIVSAIDRLGDRLGAVELTLQGETVRGLLARDAARRGQTGALEPID